MSLKSGVESDIAETIEDKMIIAQLTEKLAEMSERLNESELNEKKMKSEFSKRLAEIELVNRKSESRINFINLINDEEIRSRAFLMSKINEMDLSEKASDLQKWRDSQKAKNPSTGEVVKSLNDDKSSYSDKNDINRSSFKPSILADENKIKAKKMIINKDNMLQNVSSTNRITRITKEQLISFLPPLL